MPAHTRTLFLLLSICLAAACPALFPAYAATASPEEIGRVISVNPESWAERQGKKSQLALKAPLYVSDVVTTDASGKVQILLADDTTVTVAPQTRLELSEFAYDDVKANFAMSLTSGVSRVVTGMIVKKNPDGFKVITRHSTIGIRGTDASIIATDTATTVVANKIHVNSIVVTNNLTGHVSQLTATGTAVTASPGGNTAPRPATSEELTVATQSMRNQGETTVAASPDQGGEQAQASDGDAGQAGQESGADSGAQAGNSTGTAGSTGSEGTTLQAGTAEPLPAVSTTKDTQNANDLQELIVGNGQLPSPPVILPSGSFAGELKGDAEGAFSFNVALGTGEVSDASMWLEHGGRHVGATGGRGRIAGGTMFGVNQWGQLQDLSGARMDGRFEGGDLDELTWQAILVGGGTLAGRGDDFTHSSELLTPTLSPYQISGTYSGDLNMNSAGKVGDFGFSVLLGSGAINDARMNFNSSDLAGNIFGVSGGTGAIRPGNLGFSITDWGIQSNDTRNAELSGSFGNEGDLHGVQWKIESESHTDPSGWKQYEGEGANITKAP